MLQYTHPLDYKSVARLEELDIRKINTNDTPYSDLRMKSDAMDLTMQGH